MINNTNTKIQLLRSHLDVTSFYSLQLPKKKLNFLYINSYIYIHIQKTMILNINLNKKQNMSCHISMLLWKFVSHFKCCWSSNRNIYSTDGIINLHIHTYYWNFTQSPKHILSKISATLIKITSCIVFFILWFSFYNDFYFCCCWYVCGRGGQMIAVHVVAVVVVLVIFYMMPLYYCIIHSLTWLTNLLKK